MTVPIDIISHVTGGIFALILALVLCSGRRGRAQKQMLALAAVLTAAWAFAVAFSLRHTHFSLLAYSLELLRNLAWIAFLLRVLTGAYDEQTGQRRFHRALGTAVLFAAITMGLLITTHVSGDWSEQIDNLLLAVNLFIAVSGLVLVEQWFRNVRHTHRSAMKYLCLGVGALFAYDFYLYADALLLQRIDPNLESARGFVTALVIPVLGIGIARDSQWSQDIFVSRHIVFHTTALLGTGLYLLAMGVGGYYVRQAGGSWGIVAQTIFLFGAILILLILLFSGQLRAHIRVWISKHFFHYRYDYREEWLRIMRTLSSGDAQEHLRVRSLAALAQIVESPGGDLWLHRDGKRFECVARWNSASAAIPAMTDSDSLPRFLITKRWVVNLQEYAEDDAGLYGDLVLPQWLPERFASGLVVPLILHERLEGFALLIRPPARQHFNWEDYDLLKTAGAQAASYLAQWEASQALADARQFETFNRLSAYIVHDLKNMITQLSLLVSNAAKHKSNPQFMDDAVVTVENTVDKMNSLLAHLRGKPVAARHANVLVGDLLARVVREHSARRPVPVFVPPEKECIVFGDGDLLVKVIGNLVQNAQEATPPLGRVIVQLSQADERALIEVQDSGCGMSEEFISERLFRPFFTTKGASGMGVGAYEARECIRNLGGELSVTSSRDNGTLFQIYLPLVTLPDAAIPAAHEIVQVENARQFKEIAHR